MSQIEVSVVPVRPGERMRVWLDQESDILVGQTRSTGPWPFGVNVDNLLILDFDSDRILSSFELLLPPRTWIRKELDLLPKETEGALELCNPLERSLQVDREVRVILDEQKNIAEIKIGAEVGTAVVRLSDQCVAILNGYELVGFRTQL